jgi:hypothetical protein
LAEGQAYTTIETLLHKSIIFPGTSLFEIVKKGVPGSKLVIGKPTHPLDAPSGGFMDTSLLAEALKQAKAEKWGAYRCFVNILTDDVHRRRSRGLAGKHSAHDSLWSWVH